MKATLEFDLPEDKETYEGAIYGLQLSILIHRIDQWCRDKIKYSDKPEQYLSACEEIRDFIRAEMDDSGVPVGMI